MTGFQKARREQLWAKILLAGPSGSGKTYSALRLATGLARQCGGRIAAIDTENGRIRYYAGEFDFDDLQLEEPFTPEKYIEAIRTAASAGYKVLIVDSLTHEWNYCVQTHDKMPGNGYTNWGKITPRHDAFIEVVLQTPMHVIATVRGKDEYILEEKNGRQIPRKVGLGYRQRDNTEYEYTITFNLAQDTHIAEVMKDNTHLFEGRYEMLTEADGEAIYRWANTGETPHPKPAKAPDDVVPLIAAIAEKVAALKTAGVSREDIGAAITSAGSPANFNKIDSAAVAQAVLQKLDELGGKQ